MALTTYERAELLRLENKRDKQIADYMRMGVLTAKEDQYEYFAPPAPATEPKNERTNAMALTEAQFQEALGMIRGAGFTVEKPAGEDAKPATGNGVGDGMTDGQRAFAAGLKMPNSQFLPPGTAKQVAAIKMPQ